MASVRWRVEASASQMRSCVRSKEQTNMTDEELEKAVRTPRGIARSMTALKPYDVNLNVSYGYPSDAPGTGSDWFGPIAPMQPIAPKEVAGRTWDYVPGFNLATEPRAYEPVKFETLRMLSQAYDPLQVVIEKRKDQLSRASWTIRPKHEGGGQLPKAAQLSAHQRSTIKEITEFFRYPTDGCSF